MTINDIDGGYVVSVGGGYGLVAVIIVAVVTLMLVAVIFMVSRIFVVDMHTVLVMLVRSIVVFEIH